MSGGAEGSAGSDEDESGAPEKSDESGGSEAGESPAAGSLEAGSPKAEPLTAESPKTVVLTGGAGQSRAAEEESVVTASTGDDEAPREPEGEGSPKTMFLNRNALAAAPEAAETEGDADAEGGTAGSVAPAKGDSGASAPEEDDAPEPEGKVTPSWAKKGAAPAVDQPTAVFKALPPPADPADPAEKPRVDHATTALKITPPKGDEKDGAGKSGAAGGAGKPESDAERTSTFVPLRSDDVRPAAKTADPAKAAAPAKATGPAKAAAPAPEEPAAAKAAASAPVPPAPVPFPEAERTRQQPMPPKPPLDLLAELTNTPAPPPTPVRSTLRRIKIWTPLVLLLLIVFAIVQIFRPLPEPKLALSAEPTFAFKGSAPDLPWPKEGQSAIDVEGVGRMGQSGTQTPAPIASMAKAMTAYVILKEHPLKKGEGGPKIKVDARAEEESNRPDESTAQVKEGQEFTQREMLQLLMIPSGNNAARLLARWDTNSKDEAEFVKKMNAAAKDLGMTNSTYTDPSGYEPTTKSTADDQLKLAAAVMRDETFAEIVNMPDATIPGIDGRIYNNNNILLKPGVGGIKTGSSTPAGGNLLWSAATVVDGKERRVLGVVMGQKDAVKLADKLQLAIDNSYKLIVPAKDSVTSATVIKKGQVVGYVDDGLGGETPVVATKDLKALGWPGLKVSIGIDDAGKKVPGSAKAGTVVGQLTVGTGPGKLTAPVALQSDLAAPGYGKKLTRIG
ncbi:D-alanyl-D-alanine carboxypeptidase [Streptomyces sp. NPDC050504]|uniref:D-alanyl-D-alanine carboxypeptidase n=1 Tax=Streptomyces sp. NPDC050504 TaxID=3365618 RepID=UPI003788B71E